MGSHSHYSLSSFFGYFRITSTFPKQGKKTVPTGPRAAIISYTPACKRRPPAKAGCHGCSAVSCPDDHAHHRPPSSTPQSRRSGRTTPNPPSSSSSSPPTSVVPGSGSCPHRRQGVLFWGQERERGGARFRSRGRRAGRACPRC